MNQGERCVSCGELSSKWAAGYPKLRLMGDGVGRPGVRGVRGLRRPRTTAITGSKGREQRVRNASAMQTFGPFSRVIAGCTTSGGAEEIDAVPPGNVLELRGHRSAVGFQWGEPTAWP